MRKQSEYVSLRGGWGQKRNSVGGEGGENYSRTLYVYIYIHMCVCIIPLQLMKRSGPRLSRPRPGPGSFRAFCEGHGDSLSRRFSGLGSRWPSSYRAFGLRVSGLQGLLMAM